jgi:hypothetical protein
MIWNRNSRAIVVLVSASVLAACTLMAPAQPSPSPAPERPTRVVDAPTQSVPIQTPSQQPTAVSVLNRTARPQIGLNFIRFYVDASRRGAVDTTTPYLQPGWIFADFRNLGIHAFRQSPLADLFWDVVEPQDGQWHFSEADSVLTNPEFEPIVTLFAMQYASATPPWERDHTRFQKTLGPEARDYLDQVIARYGPYVRYWEIGNEMDHWRAADPSEKPPPGAECLPLAPPDGFSPQEQGVFLAQVAAFIRKRDPDAVIVLPGMSAPVGYPLDVWLEGVLQGGGADWFDIVNYHCYGPWQGYCRQREVLRDFLDRHNLSDKPVWMTENGSTRDSGLTIRTNYPNSPESQAADIFRRLVPAYALGDELVLWHTYIDSPNLPANNWRGYGIRDDQGDNQPAYDALHLFVRELIPFRQAEALSCDGRGANIFRFVREDGQERYVLWGAGSYTLPSGISQMTGVVPNGQGGYTWQNVSPGERIQLTDIPVLVR